ncbi:ATP-binding cassette domain-containing protein [Microbacterium sp. NPDC089695]|uniref:ATP-binding cassette domain-containing protein n=1 Tax=Microbacterium sp. NPDC089695 TaxID=3364198 RepID=UPI0038232684
MSDVLLEAQGLSVEYRQRRGRAARPALDGVDLTLHAGETVGLVGESGSGKSTLANVVLGLVPASAGRVVFDGTDITRATPTQRRALSSDIQAVFQDPYSSFNPNRTIGQSVGETLAGKGVPAAQVRARVVDMLARVGIDPAAVTRYPPQFSGGQRQRIAIARALLPQPRLVVCDEAVSALDLSVQAQILNLLADLQHEFGVAYLFITHDLGVVRHVADRTVVLRHGVLVEEGRTADVIDRPAEEYTRRLVGASLVADPDEQAARRRARLAQKTA